MPSPSVLVSWTLRTCDTDTANVVGHSALLSEDQRGAIPVDNPVDKNPIDVVICLGSSCFARGNAENLRELKAYLEHCNIAANFRTRGRLCVKKCTSGPTIAINGVEYGHVQSGAAVALLERALQERDKEC